MPLTQFRFAGDGGYNHSMDGGISSRESTPVDAGRSAHSANERDDHLGQNLEHFWIDLGGEG
jgi:hypothetical protein